MIAVEMFRAWYESPWHDPVLFLVAGVAFLAWGPRQLRVGRGWAYFFGVEIMLDAYLTGALSPLAPRHAAWIGTVAVPFVILGDLRFYALVQRATGGRVVQAVGWSFIVPILAFGAKAVWPAWFHEMQRLFLVYEVLFLGVGGVFAWLRMRRGPPSTRAWVRKIIGFEGALYGLWVLADGVILARIDAGFALRLVANVMYYALFLPFVVATAPPAWRTP